MKVLAVGAHPDDIEILAAGTLFKYREKGAEISICVLTDGSAGHREIPALRLKQIRKHEAQDAAKFLGARFFWMGIKDEILFDDQPTRLKLIEIIRRAKPDMMFAIRKMTTTMTIGQRQTMFCRELYCALKNVKTKSPHLIKLPYLYQMDTLSGIGFEPEEYVDISKHLNKKLKMLERHKSQVKWLRDHDHVEIQEMVAVQTRFRGLQSSVKHAESFRLVRGWGRVPVQRLLP